MTDVPAPAPRASSQGEAPIVLITGASGFLGSHLVDTFRTRGWQVRAQVRERSPRRWLTDGDGAPLPGVTLVDGDITDPLSLPAALRGAALVVHCAGLIESRDAERLALINHRGSENVAQAVRAACDAGVGPRRVVYISSLAVAGASHDGRARTEADEPRPINVYGRTKLLGERACFALADVCEVASVRPPAIYGPRDVGFLPMIHLLRAHLRPVTGMLGPRRRVSVVHVSDVAEAVWLAATHPRGAGGTFFVSDGEFHPFEDVTAALRDALGVWTLPLPMIPAVLHGARQLSELWERLSGREGLVTRDQVAQLSQGEWIISIDRLRELGFAPRQPLRPGWIDTIAWYRREGWLR